MTPATINYIKLKYNQKWWRLARWYVPVFPLLCDHCSNCNSIHARLIANMSCECSRYKHVWEKMSFILMNNYSHIPCFSLRKCKTFIWPQSLQIQSESRHIRSVQDNTNVFILSQKKKPLMGQQSTDWLASIFCTLWRTLSDLLTCHRQHKAARKNKQRPLDEASKACERRVFWSEEETIAIPQMWSKEHV